MTIRQLLLALIALSLVASFARAQDESVETEDIAVDEDIAGADEEERDPNAISGVFGRAFFDGQDLLAVPRFPAGEKAFATIGFSNDLKNPTYEVFFVTAHITRLGDHLNHYQNFSGVRHNRAVARGETATFRYSFIPHATVEPMEYNLVVRLYFRNDNNQTFAAVAYNSTIIVDEPLGTDPKSIGLVLTFAAMIGGAVFFYNSRAKKTYKPRVKKSEPEVTGTSKSSFDPEYVSKEHMKFREALLTRKSSSSPAKRH